MTTTTAESPTTAELISRAKAGDEDAWRALLAPHLGRLHAYIAARLPDQADDLLSVVLLHALEAFDSYEDRGWPISAWLYKIAHFRVIDAQRQLGRRSQLPLDALDWMGVHDDDLTTTIASRVDGAQVWMHVDLLLPRQAAVVRMQYQQDLSLADIAQRLGIKIGAVKALRARALRALQQRIEPEVPQSDEPAMPRGCIAREGHDICGKPIYARNRCSRHYQQWRQADRRSTPPRDLSAPPVPAPAFVLMFDPRETGLRRWLGPLEVRVMEALWTADGSLTMRELADRVDGRAYNTVSTTAQRLVEKGLLVRRRGPKIDSVIPTESRPAVEARQIAAIHAALERQ